MKRSHWGTIACLAIASCASVDTWSPLQPCNGGICKAVVSVSASGGTCAVTGVVPDPLPVSGGPKVLMWEFDQSAPDDFRFTDQGIVINDPGNQFSEPALQAGGRKFKWLDKNDPVPTPFKYTVNVRKGGLACTPFDPTIVNQG
jgi:hypothetical protein